MIVYHQALDPYHCYFRFLFYIHTLKSTNIEFEKIRLMDFYYLFPSFIKALKRNLKIKEPFENTRLKIQIFFNLQPIHENAMGYLISQGYFDRKTYIEKNDIILIKQIDESVLNLFQKEKNGKEAWIDIFFEYFQKNNIKEIKKQSKLMEQ